MTGVERRPSTTTCLDCHAQIRERRNRRGETVWTRIASSGPMVICEHSPDHWHHPNLGPESGHTFRVSVESRGSYAVEGVEGHTDAEEFMGPPLVVEVRAWSLSEALRRACAVPIDVWFKTAGKGSLPTGGAP